jgi:PAS domain S-box-containing protein
MAIKALLETTGFFPEPMLLLTRDGTIEASTPEFAAQIELPANSLAGKRLDTLAALSASAIEEYLRACAGSPRTVHGSLVFRRQAEALPFSARGVAFPPEEAPNASRVLVALQPLREAALRATERPRPPRQDIPWHEIEASLRRQSQILEVTLASIGDGVIVTDGLGRITYLNSVAEQLTGWSAQAAHHLPVGAAFHLLNERTHESLPDLVSEALRSDGPMSAAPHTQLASRQGALRPVDASAAPIRLDGRTIGAVLIFRDISEQNNAERTRAWLAALIESSTDAIVSKTLDGIITSWNPAAVRLFGYAAEEIVGKPITTIVPPELYEQEHDVLTRLRRGERVQDLETVRLTKDGRRIEVSLTVSPIRNDDGEIVGASKIARDISKRKEAERLAQEAERRKDEFLAILGHELRNPLAPIRNVSELLDRTEHARPEIRTACDILNRQVAQISRLVDDLLDVSRIAAGRMHLRYESVEMTGLLTSASESLRHAFEAKGQEFSMSFAGEPLLVMGDRNRLTQVFTNLLSNANKYTPSGGRIWLDARREDEQVVVSIRDTGMGISSTMFEEVFKLFVQAGRPDEHAGGGLGIGLTLARRLTEMHGGSIRVQSEGAGRGSEFIVRLPATGAQMLGFPAPGATSAAQARRILIADDNEDAALSLAMLLQSLGHQTRVVYDGAEALQAAEDFQPQIVFLNLQMPKLSGYEVAPQIASRPWAQGTLLVALSGWSQESYRERSREAGFHRHLVKPVEIDLVRALLEQPGRLLDEEFP